MIINDINKSSCIQPVMGTKKLFGFPGGFMCIGECINGPVQRNPVLNARRVIKFLFPLYKIADKISQQYFRVIKRQICVGQVINKVGIFF